jgi:hypothetical protein
VFVALGIQHVMRMRRIFVCGLCGSKILFPHYLINGKIFEKKKIEHEICVLICVLIFSISEIYLYARRTEREIIINVFRSASCAVIIFFVGFQYSLNFLHTFSKNNSHIKFHENPSSGSRVVPCGRTDRHGEANFRSSQFCERA